MLKNVKKNCVGTASNMTPKNLRVNTKFLRKFPRLV